MITVITVITVTVYVCNISRKNITRVSLIYIFRCRVGFIQLHTVRLEYTREYVNDPMVLHDRYIRYSHEELLIASSKVEGI